MRTYNLRSILPLSIMASFGVWLVIFFSYQKYQLEQELTAQTRSMLGERLANAQRIIEHLLTENKIMSARTEIMHLHTVDNIDEVSILDHRQHVLFSSHRDWIGQPASQAHKLFNAALAEESLINRRQILHLSEDGNVLLGLQPIQFPATSKQIRSQQTGLLFVKYNLKPKRANIWLDLVNDSLLIVLSAVVLILFLNYFLIQSLSRPLSHLLHVIQRFKNGDMLARADVSGEGELAILGNAFNAMQASLSKAMSQVADSEEKLAVTLHSIGDAVIATDTQGKVTLINGVAQELTGWTESEAIGKPLQDVFVIVNRHTRLPAPDPVEHVLRTGEVVGLANSTVLLARDGPEYQIADSAAPIRKQDSEVFGVVLVFRDVTAEYALQEKLEISEERLRLGQAYAEIGTWDADLISGKQYWSDEIYQLTKFPRIENPRWQDFLNIVIEEDRALIEQATEQHLTAGERYDVEYRIIDATGELRWMRSLGKAELDASGHPVRMCGIVQDITLRKQQELDLLETQSALKATINAIPDLLFVMDREGVYLDFHTPQISLLAATPDQIVGNSIHHLLPASAAEIILSAIREADADHYSHGKYYSLDLSDGRHWFELSVSKKTGEKNEDKFVILARDITERFESRGQLEIAARFFEQSAEAFMVTDASDKIILVNQSFSKITGYSADEVVGHSPHMLRSDKHESQFYTDISASLERQGYWQGEIWNRKKDGTLFPALVSVSQVQLPQDGSNAYVTTLIDISKQKESEERIYRMAHYDGLTGLPNRTLFAEHIEQAIHATATQSSSFALLFLDLDRFKNINDTLGHGIGDRLLIEVASRIRTLLREEDIVARFGGDEFFIKIQHAKHDEAQRAAEILLQCISQPFHIGNHELHITPSIGITLFPQDGQDMESLYKAADAAMYQAKANFRNTYRFYTRELQDASERRLMIEQSLRRAIDTNQLELHYQPQLCLYQHKLIGAEALIRWQHPLIGTISPLELISVAEETGQILDLGEWIIRNALRQANAWRVKGLPEINIAINISTLQFRQRNLAEVIAKYLEETQMPAHLVEIEITESASMNEQDHAIATIDRLNDLGIHIAIDDFGTGYSSLSYLKRLRVNKIKIDRSFVSDIAHNKDDEAIVSTIISMAKSLGLKTLAEGVESDQQLAFLKDHGCDEAQGYFYSKPLPASQFEHYARTYLQAKVAPV